MHNQKRKAFKSHLKPWRGRQFRKLIARLIEAERQVLREAELRAARNARARERRQLKKAERSDISLPL